MTYETKVMGTKYVLQLKAKPPSDWMLNLMINGVVEETVAVKNLTMRLIQESIIEIIALSNANSNPFQIEIMSKDLYTQSTGDSNLEKHNQSMNYIKDKNEMMTNQKFNESITTEFRKGLKVTQKITKKKSKKSSGEKYKMTEDMTKAVNSHEMKSMVSEINHNFKPKSVEKREFTPNILSQQYETIQTGVTSVDIDDLLQELNETQSLIKIDMDRINQRMEKMDSIIFKISSISSRL